MFFSLFFFLFTLRVVFGFFPLYLKKYLFPYLSRQVDSSDGEKLAKLNDCAWIETSAKNNLNIGTLLPFSSFFFFLPTLGLISFCLSIDRVFELCLQEIEKRYGPSQGDQPSKFGSCLIM